MQEPIAQSDKDFKGPRRATSSHKLRDGTKQIVYRTSKGKKHVVSEIFLDLMGSMMDSSSSDEDETERTINQNRLEEAQAFNASKMVEIASRSHQRGAEMFGNVPFLAPKIN